MNGYFAISDHGKVKPVCESKFSHTSNADAAEQQLWLQVSGGKPRPSCAVSSQVEASWRKIQLSLDRAEIIERQLFAELASWHGRLPANCQPLRREG